ncbi:MAG: hypothetical protein ABSB79_03125 [Syntrophales bacterium]|jgi:hypothetical protein
MNLKSYYRSMFFIGAIWNWVGAILLWISYKPMFAWLGMKELNFPLIMYAFLSLVFFFGVGYFWVSKDINQNHDIVKLGALAKTIVFLLFTFYYFSGDIHLLIEMCGVGDLVFAILFTEFLMRAKKVNQF